jgi:ankyrin repeat protein
MTGFILLYISVVNNNLSLAKLVLDSDEDPNTDCTDDSTALHTAVDNGLPDLVELLVFRGSEEVQ